MQQVTCAPILHRSHLTNQHTKTQLCCWSQHSTGRKRAV